MRKSNDFITKYSFFLVRLINKLSYISLSNFFLNRNKAKLLFTIIALSILLPIYMRQYTATYNNAGEKNKLSVEGIFLD